MTRIYLALGGNLGDRGQYLDQALALLRSHPHLHFIAVSTYYETAPVGGPPGQGNFLNAAAALDTDLREPREVLNILLEIESQLGRVRAERHGPRTIDLDLLLFGDRVVAEADLQVPHPRLAERLFVLEPLAEIAPEARHPLLDKSIAELRDILRARAQGRELFGLRALVTGATSGIGRAIALELAAAGADTFIHGRDAERAALVVADCRRLGVASESVLADLRVQPTAWVEAIWREAGGFDIWINNAGADTLTGPAARWPFAKKLDELWAIDVRGTLLLAREVGTRMKEKGTGSIINIGWDQATSGMEGDSAQLFAATKGAIMAATASLAVSLAPQVRVNCLAPGWIKTAWGENASASWQERAMREAPLARWGTPGDVAQAARWLASPAAGFITGQILRVNGGAVRG